MSRVVPLLAAICCAAGCADAELRQHTQTFPLAIGSTTCSVEVAAREADARQNLNWRRPPEDGQAFLALQRVAGIIRWNTRNIERPLDGAFLDSEGRVLATFRTVPLSRDDHVSSNQARALLLAPAGLLTQAGLTPGARIALPPKLWAYARTCWDEDDRDRRKRWDAIGYRTPAQRWGTPPGSQHDPATSRAPSR